MVAEKSVTEKSGAIRKQPVHIPMLFWSSLYQDSTLNNILSKLLAVFPHNHCLTLFQHYFRYNKAASTPTHALLRLLLPGLCTMSFLSCWLLSHITSVQPFPEQALVFTCLLYKSIENTVGKRISS